MKFTLSRLLLIGLMFAVFLSICKTLGVPDFTYVVYDLTTARDATLAPPEMTLARLLTYLGLLFAAVVVLIGFLLGIGWLFGRIWRYTAYQGKEQ